VYVTNKYFPPAAKKGWLLVTVAERNDGTRALSLHHSVVDWKGKSGSEEFKNQVVAALTFMQDNERRSEQPLIKRRHQDSDDSDEEASAYTDSTNVPKRSRLENGAGEKAYQTSSRRRHAQAEGKDIDMAVDAMELD